MRSITEHLETSLLLEGFEKIAPRVPGYNTYIIHEHAVDCSKLDKATFVKLMMDDIRKVRKIYTQTMMPLIAKHNKDDREQRKEWFIKDMKEYAEKKWRTDKRRQEYYMQRADEIEKIENPDSEDIFRALLRRISFNFGPNNYYNHEVNTMESSLRRDCESIWNSDTDLIQQSGGWMFLIDADPKDMATNYGVYLDLILPDDLYKERQAKRDAHNKALLDYYASKGSGGYTGD